MIPNPVLGVFLHWMGGLASGSFYVPFRLVRKWSWETYWLVGGVFSWIVAPWVIGLVMTTDLIGTLSESLRVHTGNCLWTYFFGAMWGLGGLTFGLTMRYLGMSLGMAVALGYCAAFGTLMPPIFRGEFVDDILRTTPGQVILVGVAVCLAGIAVAGLAGMWKEREMDAKAKTAAIKEFNFKKGILVATFSGVMSACFSYGLAAGDPIKTTALDHGTTTLWQGLPVLVILLAGGFTTNCIWCVILHIRNKSGHEYLSAVTRPTVPAGTVERVSDSAITVGSPVAGTTAAAVEPVPLATNYFFSALAGVTWYMQFFFYTMGETQMGAYKFSSWTLHMASIIIFSTIWGIILHEWKGASKRVHALITAGIVILIASTMIVGYGTKLQTQ